MLPPRFTTGACSFALCAMISLSAAETPTTAPAAAPSAASAAAPTPAARPAPVPPAPDRPPAPLRARISPHETLSTVIGDRRSGVRLTLTYGRPYSKDPKTGEIRKIWGGLVAWDKPDRLGADEATLLIAPVSLKFGDTTIPAGAYTLYLVPSETGATQLAFSSAIGKWGVPVDTSKDVARIPLERHAIEPSIDQLTLGIEGLPDGSGGFLKIAWEKTVFTGTFSLVK